MAAMSRPSSTAILRTLPDTPGVDQLTLAQLIALDTTSTADITTRLEAKGWILREVLPRRQRRLSQTPAGAAVLADMRPGIEQMYVGMMDCLDAAEQREFMRLLGKFVLLNDQEKKPPRSQVFVCARRRYGVAVLLLVPRPSGSSFTCAE